MKTVTINSLGFDGLARKSWNAELVESNDNLLVFVGEFTSEIVHPHLGIIRPKTQSYEYYWLDRWYNVFRFHEPDGAFRNFYCNINMPPTFDGDVLEYIDLDLDLIVDQNGRYEVLDEDDFESNADRFAYSDEIKRKAFEALTELTALIGQRKFPFNTL